MSETQQAGSQDGPMDLYMVHGHLAFARFPVLVGHYVGDAFAGTEARLDRALDGRLAERRKLGLYPGRIGANAVLLQSHCKPPGAVVVGLGQPADLSIGTLRETLRQGILAYVVETLDLGCAQANPMLGGRPKPKLRTLEIIELFEDRAYETARAARKAIEADPDLKSVFSPQPKFDPRGGGRRHAPIAPDPNWWQPIQITMPSVGGTEDRSLSFPVGGGFARGGARRNPANLDLGAPL